MSEWKPEKIKLKRFNTSIQNTNLSNQSISFGEPFIVSDTSVQNKTKTYLGLCDLNNETDIKFTKTYSKDIVNYNLFFKNLSTGDSVGLIDDEQNDLKLDPSSVKFDSDTTLSDLVNGNVAVALSEKSESVKIENAAADTTYYVTGTSTDPTTIDANGEYTSLWANKNVYFTSQGVLFGAAWNDFAEHRLSITDTPGTCVVESVGGILIPSEAYKQGGAYIISDTFGMVIGDNAENSAPVAVAGRVLAFVENKDKLQPGDALKTAPGGKLAKMSRREIRRYPDRIVGYVSEIPTYETWNNVKVNGRIWVKI